MKTFGASFCDHSNCCLQSGARNRRRWFRNGLILFLAVCPFEPRAAAQEPAEKTAAVTALTRPCPALPADSKPAHKEKSKANTAAHSNEAVSACLEAKGSPLDIQEFFQSYVRAQSWRIGEEKIIEDGWIFARYLDKNELLQFAKEGLFAGRVNWTEGKALVQVRTRELDGGFSRVEITARFQGGGQSVDRFAPPKESWDLDSNGALEKILISALEEHMKSVH